MGLDDNIDIKERIRDAISARGVYFRKVNNTQYLTRCPSCGDKLDNPNTGHLYIKIDTTDNSPIVFQCKRCPFSGVFTRDTLELLGISDDILTKELESMNKNCAKYDAKNIANQKSTVYNFKLPTADPSSDKLLYVYDRLKCNFSQKDLTDIRIIDNFREFIKINELQNTIKPKDVYILKNLADNYVGFMSNNCTHILFRDITDNQKYRWVKYNIIPNANIIGKMFYAIASDVDIFTDDTIEINLSEGVFDILSVAYNLGHNNTNTVNIAVGGSSYKSTLLDIIGKGIIGSNVTVNLFSDNDNTEQTSIEHHRKVFHDIKLLFGNFYVHYNRKYKDCGVPLEDIILKSYRL